ncbi:putative glutathione synthetase [Podospora fimiseda]|uniref:Glutathione synthetase n=1 Tax=Podospora fimiseda TaxID=252190 RepID=A0AAN7BQ92_9PEZI|nr:putative glutathione synthetase [Podospora fimiseda]
MSSLTGGSYPPTLINDQEKERLVQTIKDWSIANGLAVRPAIEDPDGILAINAPVTLFPSPFPKTCFEEAKAIQTSYNELYSRISQDEEFLGSLVQEVAGGDDFIANLWDLHLKVKSQGGYTQKLTLGLFRSDYMVHQDNNSSLQIKQVEFNTIASSFGGLSAQTSLLHSHLSQTEYPLLHSSPPALSLPQNQSTQRLAAGLRTAYHAYGPSSLNHPTCVLFLVQDGERNIFDQRHLEYALSSSSIPVFRLPFSQILQHTRIAPTPDRQLLYSPPPNPCLTFEAAVTYLRAGYGPTDYPTPSAWQARLQIERSNTIACPSVLTQLSGMKKVQQVLATPDISVLSKFTSSQQQHDALWKTFTNIYPLDNTSSAGQLARKLATDPIECLKYVMKPQREGGGNNFYRGAIPKQLEKIPEEHWGSFILMKIITPPPLSNTILRAGKLEHGGVICELGVYGTCLWDRKGSGEILHNEEAGYLLRTKGDQSEEGGVAAGYGCMDSVALV